VRWLGVIALAGCSFHQPTVGNGDDAPPIPIDTPSPVDAFQGFVARYNLGGPSYTAASGPNAGTWAADNSVLNGICTGTPAGGDMPAFPAPIGTSMINGTTDMALFDKTLLGDPINCTIRSLPNGNYNLRLLFAELYRGGQPCAGGNIAARRVTISVQGTTVDTNLDVIATGGGCAATNFQFIGNGHAFDRTYPTTVTSGQLALTLAKGTATDFAIVSAIELVQTP
jgi:hypothetical protein